MNTLNQDPDLEQRRQKEKKILTLVLRVCQTVMERQRYFVVEQPWSAESWRYDGVLARLWQRDDVWLVRGDQCAYGKVDSESGLPYLKATGFMTNSQLIANQVAKRCCCTVEHQPLIGNNKFGSRTKQAAEYPVGLAEAICEGVRGQMKFDYAMNLKLDAAYPAEERERSRSPRQEADEHEG